ncbi:MAG: DUF1778 domain-containing protein [Thermomicrobiales bacterium]|nr:DUF1778 domain-containing protein [Thermomicrobiales bacterium]MCC6943428.1 DUF1778 domain-containing protein [Thermomicrobiales bacterium]
MVNTSSTTRDQAINIRVSRRQRDVIDRAAQALGKSRSDFMIETAFREAENVLVGQTLFLLDDDAFTAFNDLLDNPPSPSESLRQLMHTSPPWE